MHDELFTADNVETIKDLAKERDPVKGKVLELIHLWAHVFRNASKYSSVTDAYNLLKMEGHSFPASVESGAMFVSEAAPEWKDADTCQSCRNNFTKIRRKVSFARLFLIAIFSQFSLQELVLSV